MNKNSTTFNTFKLLLPFIWPRSRKDLKIRVIFAGLSMILAKVASVYTPLILGNAVDSLNELSNGTNFLISSTLSTSNYDATLVGWGAQSGSVISGVNIHFGNSEYTSGSLADQRRQDLINAGWTITDGGYA